MDIAGNTYMELIVVLTRQHLIDIDQHANLCNNYTAPLIHQISPTIVSMLAKVHISTISRYYFN